jgi:bifunctional non-homologous end joining protein LigD
MQLLFQPMPLLKRRSPFDDPDFVFEVKYDGFRALAVIEHGGTKLISRNGHRFASFATLENLISTRLPDTKAVIDGEICSLDKKGRPQFRNLLFHRGDYPCFLVFDLLMREGKDCRRERLLDRSGQIGSISKRTTSLVPAFQGFLFGNNLAQPTLERPRTAVRRVERA